MNISKLLIGRTLKTEELKDEKFNVFWGLPILSSDAISSVAYAGEEILWVLVPALGLLSYKYMIYQANCRCLFVYRLYFNDSNNFNDYNRFN